MPETAEVRDFKLTSKHETWTSAGPLLSHLQDRDIRGLAERSTATVAEPGALGLWGFATGTWMAATILGGYVPQRYGLSAAPTAIVFAGIVQFIAGLYAFRRANALTATAFTCFGAFNTAVGLMLLLRFVGAVTRQSGYHEQLGFLLESFAFIALVLAAGAVGRNVVLFLVLAFLAIGYCLTGVGQFTLPAAPVGAGGGGLGIASAAGGGCLLASAFFAYYLGLALLVNSTWNQLVLPIFGRP